MGSERGRGGGEISNRRWEKEAKVEEQAGARRQRKEEHELQRRGESKAASLGHSPASRDSFASISSATSYSDPAAAPSLAERMRYFAGPF